jgi:hypothetical protein
MQLQSIRRELLYLFKKGSLPDSHYNIILDKKASGLIEVFDMEKNISDFHDFHRYAAHSSTVTRSVNP